MLPINQLMEHRQRLPVFEHKEKFLRLLDQQQCIVLIGETGSGKTTQVPQWCVEYLKNSRLKNGGNLLKVACTQPRRLAKISVARRVAEEMNVALGTKVGYSVRFENCTSFNTRLKFLTDGLLMRELFTYSNFDPYGVAILDEAHERSLNTVCTIAWIGCLSLMFQDILLGFLKNAMRRRPNLKVIVMSATVNAEKFCEYFVGCSVLRIPGRLFHVDIHYINTQGNKYRNEIVSVVSNIHIGNPPGDILVFLTGEQEIEEVCEKI
ncbi:RNA helicase [Aphelenchoides bicaudatus]|nr:RNA helicase [Aphelenchoides bicaudatus]